MKLFLVRSCSLIALLACSSMAAAAQTAAKPPSQAQWEAAFRARELRAAKLRDEVNAVDARIEGRIDALLEALRAISDSKDSRTKVARMKRDTIDQLQKTIEYYQRKRAAMLEELRRPTWNLSEEQKRAVIARFDERIEKRVAQIIAVQKSLPTEQDYDRYEVTSVGWYGTTYEVSEDYRQNQRLTAHTNAQRDKVVAGLRASIARIEQQNRTLKAQNAPAEEIAKNDALIAERRRQLATSLAPVETPTRAIGSKEAADLDKALKTEIADLNRDLTTLFARYQALIQEVSAVNAARAGLAAAKAKTPQ